MTLNQFIKILQGYPNQDLEMKILCMSDMFDLCMECDFIKTIPMDNDADKNFAAILIHAVSIGAYKGYKKEELH